MKGGDWIPRRFCGPSLQMGSLKHVDCLGVQQLKADRRKGDYRRQRNLARHADDF
jgi:hypothetical protein